MALDLPANASQVVSAARADVQAELPDSNPFLPNSFLGALTTALGVRTFDGYRQLEIAFQQAFPQTAIGEYLETIGAWIGLSRNPATEATGSLIITGTAGNSVPIGATYQSSDGLQYEVTTGDTLASTPVSVALIERVSTTATVTTATEHGYASGISVTIAGANEAAYNGTFTIIVTSATEFTYTVSGSPATPATGTITSTTVSGTIIVASVGEGADYNQLAGASLTLTSPIAGVNNAARVLWDGISGGTDSESDADFRSRVIYGWANPVAHFNEVAITLQARTVPGVTRVFVRPVTPAVGQVTIYFVRDNDATTIIPDAGEVAAVKAAILEIKPANTSDDDVIVEAPTAVPVDFTFTALFPDSTTMRIAIENSLTQLFAEGTDVGVELSEDAYRSAIYQTVDTATGQRLTSFTLSAPSGDISVGSDELPTLGTVTFP